MFTHAPKKAGTASKHSVPESGATPLGGRATKPSARPASNALHTRQFVTSGEPLDPTLKKALAPRFGFPLDHVRIHADEAAAATAESLGARAYTWGSNVGFARGAYQPQTSSGRGLIAHELTHVGQQLSGSAESEEAQEVQADHAEAGASVAFPQSGPLRPALRLRTGGAVDFTVVIGSAGRAAFSAEIEGGIAVSGSGSTTNLEPGEYRVEFTGTAMIVHAINGPPLPRTTRFDIPWNPGNARLIRALGSVRGAIPLHVRSGPNPSNAGGDPPVTANSPEASEARRRELDAMPEHVRKFLFAGGREARDEDYETLLRIAKKLQNVSEEELAEYPSGATSTTSDLTKFEQSVDSWLARLTAQHARELEQEEATRALFGMDSIYEMYRSWKSGLLMGGPPSWIYAWERTPTKDLPETREGTLNQLYLNLRRALQPHGYSNLTAFEAALQRFILAFRESAYAEGVRLLERYEQLLLEQQSRYEKSGEVQSLHRSLAPARAAFERADKYRADVTAQYGSSWDPSDVNAFYAAGSTYKSMIESGRQQVAAQAGDHPLLGTQDFPREDVGRADDRRISRIIHNYITSGLEHTRSTRKRLEADHEIIFKLDILVQRVVAHQGIPSGSIWTKVVEDHVAPTVEQVVLDVFIGVLAVAAGLLSGGSALAAVASVGFSSYLALQSYENYALRSDAYGAQLLSQEPELGWVVLAVLAVAGDLAIVASVIRPIRPALQQFQRTGDLVELESKLSGVEERVRRSIMARAELETRARAGWSVLPKGALHGSLFGLEYAVEYGGKLVYAVVLNLRRGINSFNKWVLTREAVDLIGDINRLKPEELAKLKTLYGQAVADAQRIATHGRTVGMTPVEIEDAIQRWAARGSGTADDLVREMSRREIVVDRAMTTGRVTRSSLPPGHVGGVRVTGPNGAYLQFLPLDQAGRAQGVVARLNGEMLARATGSSASGSIPGRAATQDRGHLLARILGGPDIPQNLAPLLRPVNQRDMRMVEIAIRNAIRDGSEATLTITPIYRAGRSDPEAFLMSVRWKDARQEVFRFANP